MSGIMVCSALWSSRWRCGGRSRRCAVGRAGYCPGGQRRRRSRRSGGHMSAVEAHITGTVWKIECAVGDEIEEGDTVAILESMKMEMPVEAEDSGKVAKIC